VARDYRGQGVFDACYRAYKSFFEKKYQFAVTEISTKNLRSVRAHTRIGFREVHRYMAPEQGEWSVVLWDWKSPDANEFIDINSPPVIL
jgi:RimJ/RimL family protein N-acetyltransferase